MNRFTVEELIQGSRDRLGLALITGKSGFTNLIEHVKVQRYVFHETSWDNLEPKAILILSAAALASLDDVSSSECKKIFRAIASASIPCIVLSRVRFLPDFMIRFSTVCNIPLLISIYDEFLLESRLLQILRRKINQVILMHGALVNVNGIGVMITGDSGTGKTRCAVGLVQKGHFWIADDMVEIRKKKDGMLHGCSHETIRNCLELKNVGIVNAVDYFGETPVCKETVVDIMARFENVNRVRKAQGSADELYDIMGVRLPCVRLPVYSSGKDPVRHIDSMTKNFPLRRLAV
jgi:HPr kinase/phosphorylase